jgi:hypothetical protein
MEVTHRDLSTDLSTDCRLGAATLRFRAEALLDFPCFAYRLPVGLFTTLPSWSRSVVLQGRSYPATRLR